jgi:hypothetical protein
MAEEPPHPSFTAFGERLQIRTYANLGAFSVSGSEHESEHGPDQKIVETDSEAESDDSSSIQDRIAWKFNKHKEFIETEITKPGSKWDLRPVTYFPPQYPLTTQAPVIYLKTPTASYLSHKHLHPSHYHNMLPIASLDHLATLVGALEDWKVRYENIGSKNLNKSRRVLRKIRRLPVSTSEKEVEGRLATLVAYIASTISWTFGSILLERKVTVGGLLARHDLDIRSKSDFVFVTDNKKKLLCTEIKTLDTYPDKERHYLRSRG